MAVEVLLGFFLEPLVATLSPLLGGVFFFLLATGRFELALLVTDRLEEAPVAGFFFLTGGADDGILCVVVSRLVYYRAVS
jgi:hypothetical protein